MARGANGTVVPLGRAQPDYRQAACAQVAAARAKLGLNLAGFAGWLAGAVGWNVMPATAGRWETGAVPPGDVLFACVAVVQDTPAGGQAATLLPGPGEAGDPTGAVLPYADRGLITRRQWNGIITGARDHLWLYGMAEFGYATDADVPGILTDAAGGGCAVRILLLHPGWEGMGAIDADEGSPPGTLAARIRRCSPPGSPLCGRRGCRSVRTGSRRPCSIVRGDDRMLITPYLRYATGSNSPTFELTRGSAARMFSRYERHFTRAWNESEDWT